MSSGRESLLSRVMALGHPERTARALILSGRVRVAGELCAQEGRVVRNEESVEVVQRSPYPGRGAFKLKGALDAFGVDVSGRVALDLGAAHGGFVAVLLERGARRVYAVDVAYGMLDYRLRTDPRVVVLERRNVRDLNADWFSAEDCQDARPWIVTADLSFISLRTVLPILAGIGGRFANGWEAVALVKPQFERSAATDRGVLRDEAVRAEVLDHVRVEAAASDLELVQIAPAALRGRRGNQEVFVHLRPR